MAAVERVPLEGKGSNEIKWDSIMFYDRFAHFSGVL